MKYFVLIYLMFAAMYSCGQNGPTQPTVVLSWTQSTTPGVTKNCIYRGASSGVYALPGTCIAANTTYTDSTAVPGATYFYAVTAQVSGTESAYSAPVSVSVPTSPSAPTGLTAPTVTKNVLPGVKPGDLTAKIEWIKPLK
jgi:fibronectin type 3 domain-containing protein